LSIESTDVSWQAIYVFTGADSDRYTVVSTAGAELLKAREGEVANMKANFVLRLYRITDGKPVLQTPEQIRFINSPKNNAKYSAFAA
jgi:hypothetical protein